MCTHKLGLVFESDTKIKNRLLHVTSGCHLTLDSDATVRYFLPKTKKPSSPEVAPITLPIFSSFSSFFS